MNRKQPNILKYVAAEMNRIWWEPHSELPVKEE